MSESRDTHFTCVRVDSAGRVVIPAEVREHLGIVPGQDLILSEDARGIRLNTFEQAVQAAQEAFAPYRVPGVSVVDELIRERADEAGREHETQQAIPLLEEATALAGAAGEGRWRQGILGRLAARVAAGAGHRAGHRPPKEGEGPPWPV